MLKWAGVALRHLVLFICLKQFESPELCCLVLLLIYRCAASARSRAELPVWTDRWKRSAICSVSWLAWHPPGAVRPCRWQVWCRPSGCRHQLTPVENSSCHIHLHASSYLCSQVSPVRFQLPKLSAHPHTLSVWREPAVTQCIWTDINLSGGCALLCGGQES